MPSRNRQLRERIAQQLGISPAAFDPAFASVARSADGAAGAFDVALGRECLELLETYCRILDPERRRRCLQIVREAASAGEPDGHAS